MLEERRLREEEERRLQEEQEEKEREERERYEAEERKLLDVERQEFECIRGNITGRIQEQLDKKQEAHEVRRTYQSFQSHTMEPLAVDIMGSSRPGGSCLDFRVVLNSRTQKVSLHFKSVHSKGFHCTTLDTCTCTLYLSTSSFCVAMASIM